MTDGKEPRERSVSGEIDVGTVTPNSHAETHCTPKDSDADSHAGEQSNPGAGKPGRKKNPNSQAARRDQNRIAQREFRLRKQQRIRDLEARVEILSGGKDEAMGEMRNMLKDLMAENHTLRSLLRSLAAFIGDGAGGILPKLGWEMSDFNNFVNRSETDTAWEGYQRRKKLAAQSPTAASSIPPTSSSKRNREDEAPATMKKARTEPETEANHNYPLLVPMTQPLPPSAGNNVFAPASRQAIYPDIMRNTSNSPMYMHPTSNASPVSQYGVSSSSMAGYPTSYVSSVMDQTIPSMSYNPTSNPSIGAQQQHIVPNNALPSERLEEEDDSNKHEAYKLIHYHLDNYKRNSKYCLPSSLRPTLVQKTISHESVIDSIIHPELRDRMILLRDRYDLVDCLMEYRQSVTIHGEDVLAHANWEIGEKWLRQYG
ncbi:hypothetical protein AX16_000070 [Volvariella volvacea WC 439]|nr:hypothetical protein AX16_000070 [Volvariella volvacea WC 439]